MYLINGLGILNQYGVVSFITARNDLYAREVELDPQTREGILIALSIASGAFFVGCICMTISMCNWRMKYLRLKKELDDRGYGIEGSPPQQRLQLGKTPAKVAQVEPPVKMPVKPMVSTLPLPPVSAEESPSTTPPSPPMPTPGNPLMVPPENPQLLQSRKPLPVPAAMVPVASGAL